MRFPVKITSSCIWVAIPVDWIILHWYACGADGRVVYHIFLPMVIRCALRARELRYQSTTFLMFLWLFFRLDLDKWINEPPSESSEDEQDIETIFDPHGEHKYGTENNNK